MRVTRNLQRNSGFLRDVRTIRRMGQLKCSRVSIHPNSLQHGAQMSVMGGVVVRTPTICKWSASTFRCAGCELLRQ